MRRNRRVTYRPSKQQSIFGGIVGCVFVLIGLFIAIPGAGLFGIFWTLVALGITVMNFYQAFGEGYIGPSIEIEGDEEDSETSGGSPEERLRKLQALYDQRLITPEEYEEKRKEILREL